MVQTNTVGGVHLSTDANQNSFFGGDYEGRTNEINIIAGAEDNKFYGGVLGAGIINDNGTRTILSGVTSPGASSDTQVNNLTVDGNSTTTGTGRVVGELTLQADLRIGDSPSNNDYTFSRVVNTFSINAETGVNTDAFSQVASIDPSGNLSVDGNVNGVDLSNVVQIDSESDQTSINLGIADSYTNLLTMTPAGNDVIACKTCYDISAYWDTNNGSITVKGKHGIDDRTPDEATWTFSEFDPGEEVVIYTNRASAPTLAGTGLTFNELPNSDGHVAATDQVYTFFGTAITNVIDYIVTTR